MFGCSPASAVGTVTLASVMPKTANDAMQMRFHDFSLRIIDPLVHFVDGLVDELDRLRAMSALVVLRALERGACLNELAARTVHVRLSAAAGRICRAAATACNQRRRGADREKCSNFPNHFS